VRRLEPVGEETCLLQLLSDDELPRDYLADLIDPPTTQGGRRLMHTRISETLCDFIENTKGSPQFAPRRLEAVRRLGTFECQRSFDLLQALVRARRHLVLPAESHELRDAARRALASRS